MKIILAVDGSVHSKKAGDFLARLAGARGHQVTMVHVTPPVFKSLVRRQKSYPEVLRDAGVKLLKAAATDLSAAASFHLRPRLIQARNFPQGILQAADKEKGDLIVLGARGLSALDRFLLGSVSQALTRHAKAAVLIVHGTPKRNIVSRRPLKVLAALDGSQSSQKALVFLRRLAAKPRDLRLTLLHVVEPPAVVAGGVYGMGMDPLALEASRDEWAARRRSGRRLLDRWKQSLKPAFGAVETRLAEGPAAVRILDAAKKGNFDLVVMGKRGLSGIRRFLLGSVSQKVSTHAPCAVLMVPEPGKNPQSGGAS